MRTAAHFLRLLSTSLLVCAGIAAETTRPNIVFIMLDDQGAMDAGFAGSTYYETPSLDRVAREGMIFRQAYTCGPNCAPTRASLMSGQYGPRTCIYTVDNSDRGSAKDRKLVPIENRKELEGSVVTWAERVQAAGYATASIGKWHLGSNKGTLPTDQGFLLNIAGSEAGHPTSYFAPYNLAYLTDGPKGENLNDRLAEEAVGFIKANANKPFCLYFPQYAVHGPIQSKPDLTARFKDRKPVGEQKDPEYAGLLFGADQAVGRVLATLDELHLTEKTVVVVTSDNGGKQGVTGNAPLRGYKGMLYEGGIRVPLAVRWPGRIAAGSVSEVPVITVDFYPTLLAMTGSTPAKDTVLDGVNIMPLMQGGAKLDREALYWHFPCYLEGGGGGKSGKQSKQGAKPDVFRTRPVGAIRMGNWKLLEFFEDSRVELYDLSVDQSEQHDLAQDQPKRRDELIGKLRQWREQVKAPVPTKLNPEYVGK
ncbi:MAG: sulfatase [Planctomycetota bacterium]